MDGTAPPLAHHWIEGPPVTLPDGRETIARCAAPGCDAPFVPIERRSRYCGPACARAAKLAAPARKAGDARRSARFQQRHAAWRLARRALRRAGIDPRTVPALETLRGAGHVEGWRAIVGLPAESRGRRRGDEPEHTPAPAPRAPWGAPVGAQPDHVAWGLSLDGVPRSARPRHLHGLVAHLVGESHTQVARWALAMPQGARGAGWGVVLFRETDAVRLAGLSRGVQIGSARAELHLGAVVRLRAPALREPGRYRVTIDAVTPVSHMIAGRTRPVTQPSVDTMQRCAGDLLQRLGLSTGRMHIASVACETSPERVDLGGHVRGIVGWVGRVVVECNAPAAWALSLARDAGLGGRTAFGLGRVRVSAERVGDS